MTVTVDDTQTVTCKSDDCEETGQEWEFRNGEYCSTECFHRDRGRRLLTNIKYDHRWCHGCFRRLKTINKPRAKDPGFVVGYQFLTEHARYGEFEGRAVVNERTCTDDRRPPSPSERLTMTGTICECGTTDHRDDYLREASQVSVREAAKRLCRALVWTGAEGQHDKTIDARELARTLRESAEERGEWDWALAVGRAVDD